MKYSRFKRHLVRIQNILIGMGCCVVVYSHPAIDQRIEHATQQIQYSPQNANLFVKRGLLHSENQHWQAALKDFDRAGELGLENQVLYFLKGRLYFQSGDFSQAADYLGHNIELSEQDREVERLVSSHLLLGEIAVEQTNWVKAVYHFDLAITLNPAVNPGFYILRAESHVHADNKNFKLALIGLDDVLKLNPRLYSVAVFAIELEIQRSRFNLAQQRIDRLTEYYPGLRSHLLQILESSDSQLVESQ